MGDTLKLRIQQTRFDSPIQEAVLNVFVTAGHLRERVNQICGAFDLTHAQYNVLRILKGGPQHGYPRREILERMLERAPDVTRLIDRLEERKLVERERSPEDRRLSLTRITPAGLAILDRIQPRIRELLDDLGERLDAKECRELSRLCEALYSGGE